MTTQKQVFQNVLQVFGEFLPFFSADPLKHCQVGWGASLHSYFQVSPEMLPSGAAV